jgi:hypothetical protein
MFQFKKTPNRNKGLNFKPKPLGPKPLHNIYQNNIHLPSLSCQIPLVKQFFFRTRVVM